MKSPAWLPSDPYAFLPLSPQEVRLREWDELDVILVSGDAYVDHPAFGVAVVGRLLESLGLRVGIIAQPRWQPQTGPGGQRLWPDFTRLGRPRLFFGISAGSMDTMVKHYTAAKKRRSDDPYTPGNKAGARPDRATMVYARILKEVYPDVPVLAGGIEASLRRLVHYDYWENRRMPSLLCQAPLDLLVWGMGEAPLEDLVRLLKKGVPFSSLGTLPQTALLVPADRIPRHKAMEDVFLPSWDECRGSDKAWLEAWRLMRQSSLVQEKRRLIQGVDGDRVVVVNPPLPQASEADMDRWAALPYTRLPHPSYQGLGPIPAWETVRHSVIMHRGCFGGCSFCAITAHQGKLVSSRSPESILGEVQRIRQTPGFTGVISDLGGPTANMYRMGGKDQSLCRDCRRPSCLMPARCPNLNHNHQPLVDLYRQVRQVPGIKHVYVASGIRYDMFYGADGTPDPAMAEYMKELVQFHVGGRLKVAPEQVDPQVLGLMGKPDFAVFRNFARWFEDINRQLGLKQELIPYFISGHPGSTLESMARLALDTKDLRFKLEQVQDFTPTPMTSSSFMFDTGLDPASGRPLAVPRSPREKELQKMLFFWYLDKNRQTIKGVLQAAGLENLAKRLFGR